MSVVFWQCSIRCRMSMVVRPRMPIIYIIRFSCFCSSDIPYFMHITGLIRKALWRTVHIQISVMALCAWQLMLGNISQKCEIIVVLFPLKTLSRAACFPTLHKTRVVQLHNVWNWAYKESWSKRQKTVVSSHLLEV